MAYFYKYVDPAKLLASHEDLFDERHEDRENSQFLQGSPSTEKKAPMSPHSNKDQDGFVIPSLLTNADYPKSDM